MWDVSRAERRRRIYLSYGLAIRVQGRGMRDEGLGRAGPSGLGFEIGLRVEG